MIHDLNDLEPLFQRYDHEKVLVGPLLSLWTNSSFRVFNIAGKGGKIHETIGLGFFELEIDAQRRRADIVAVLEDCFDEVQIFDSQLEMAEMAHTLWANDETARFLATVSWETKPRPIRETSQNQNLADPNKFTVLSDDRNDESSDEKARQVVAPPDMIDFGPRLRAAVASSSVSKKYRLWVFVGAYLALCFVVGFLIGTMIFTNFTSMRQTANEATLSRNTAASITAGHDPSQATERGTSSVGGTASREAKLREAVRVTSPSLLTSQPGVGDEADAAPFPGAQSSQNPSYQTAANEQLSQSPTVQGNQVDGSISLPQSSAPEMVKPQFSATETVSLSIPQPQEVARTASTQIMAADDGPQLLSSEPATPEAAEALSTARQRQASNLAIIPLPRPRPLVNAVSPARPRHRIGPLGEGTRSPLLSLFSH